MGSPASHGVPQPREGWQPCHGIGGSFAVESAAAFVWNRWQACYGISGNFRVERVAALPWNQWQNSPGIGGSFAVEYAPRRALSGRAFQALPRYAPYSSSSLPLLFDCQWCQLRCRAPGGPCDALPIKIDFFLVS